MKVYIEIDDTALDAEVTCEPGKFLRDVGELVTMVGWRKALDMIVDTLEKAK